MKERKKKKKTQRNNRDLQRSCVNGKQNQHFFFFLSIITRVTWRKIFLLDLTRRYHFHTYLD